MDRILEQNDTLFKLFEYSAARWHGRPMASYIDGAQAYTYGSFQEKVLKMSVLLARHHVYGGKVAILAENCPNWTMAFFASAAMGRVAVPILPASSQMEGPLRFSTSVAKSRGGPAQEDETHRRHRYARCHLHPE